MKNKPEISGFILVVSMYCVGMYILPMQMMRFNLSLIPGDLGDARLNNYFLEHGYKWLTGQVASFWDAPFFYPTVRTMSFSDNHLGTLPIYALFRLFQFDRETSYQFWLLVIFTLNYFSCALVLRKLSINTLGAAAGAYIFAFSLPMVAQMNHSQLLPRFMIPFAFYFSFKYFENKSNKTLAFICLAVSIQFYLAMYMGFFLILGLISFITASVLLRDKRRITIRGFLVGSYREIPLRVITILLSFIILLPLIMPYRMTSLELGTRSWGEIELFLPRITSYFSSSNGSLLWGWLSQVAGSLGATGEHHLFVGALPFAAFMMMPLFYYRYRAEPLIKNGMMAWLTMLILTLLTLHFGASLYKFALYIPGMKGLRVVTRIILMELFLLSIIIGVIITKISDKILISSTSVKTALTFIILFLISIDQYVTISKSSSYSKIESQIRLKIIENLARRKNPTAKIIAYMPQKTSDSPTIIHLDAMMAAQNLNMATVNGYSGKFPRGYIGYFFEHYDQCDNYMIWKIVSTQLYNGSENRYKLFDNVEIIGRDGCF
jgi:hypothetical protein